MQTFLPYPNFTISAMCLDTKRLGKQRVEARQIQTAIQNGGGWSNHPAVTMWKSYPVALMAYGDACIREWVRRGHLNNMPMMLVRETSELPMFTYKTPPWLGDPNFHASHRSNLLRKDIDHYSQFGWTEPPDLEYVWPNMEKEHEYVDRYSDTRSGGSSDVVDTISDPESPVESDRLVDTQ